MLNSRATAAQWVSIKRAWCQFMHRRRFRGTVGLGWYGHYCPKCGYSYFVDWTDDGLRMLGRSPQDTKHD